MVAIYYRILTTGLLALAIALPTVGSATSSVNTTDTFVFMRHAEKPAAGLGQLSCRGLNRALALPTVLEKRFGKPTALFAPNPGERFKDHGIAYNYIRPLATIEPSAIRLAMPVNTDFGVTQTAKLQAALIANLHHRTGTMTWIAWEHSKIPGIVRGLIEHYQGNPKLVPRWQDDDFDSVYIVTLQHDKKLTTVHFSIEKQGLNGQSEQCPNG